MTEKRSLQSLIADNPAMVILFGLCPAVAATSDVRAALGMSALLLIILVLTAGILSALQKLIPQQATIPAVFLVAAGVTSVIELLVHALFPPVYQLLGIYISVLSVDLLVFAFGREALSQRIDKVLGLSLKYGLFFALILLPVAALREVLGAGSFAGVEITALNDVRIPVFIQSAGGFMALACAAAVLNHKNGKTNVTAWFSEWTDSFTEKSPEGEEGSES